MKKEFGPIPVPEFDDRGEFLFTAGATDYYWEGSSLLKITDHASDGRGRTAYRATLQEAETTAEVLSYKGHAQVGIAEAEAAILRAKIGAASTAAL